MHSWRRIFIFATSFILATGAILTLSHRAGLFDVQTIPVELSFADPAFPLKTAKEGPGGLQRRLEANIKNYAGKKIWDIDLESVRAAVLSDEWVQDALISRRFPNGIRVSVRPQRAVLGWLAEEDESANAVLPVIADGRMLGALPIEDATDLTFLRGKLFAKDQGKRQKAIALLEELPNEGPIRKGNVSEISWNSENGFVLTLSQPPVEVYLGEEKVSTKVQRVSQVLSYMISHQVKGRVVDASFKKKVLVRVRKGP